MTTLKLKEENGQYHLRCDAPDGTPQSVILSPDDLLALARNALQLSDRILRAKAPKGSTIAPTLTSRVTTAHMNTDLHRTNLILTFELPDQMRVAFEIPSDVAEAMAERLPARVAELKRSDRTSH